MPTIPIGINVNGFPVQDPRNLALEAERLGMPVGHWIGQANKWVTTTGPNPGVGSFLMLFRHLSQISANSISSWIEFQELNISVKHEKLVFVQAEAIYPAGEVTPETLYLVHFADRRLLLFQSSADANYNLVSPDGVNFFDDSLDSGNEWTWQTLLNDLWNYLPIAITVNSSPPQLAVDSSVAFELTDNPRDFKFHGIPAWESINIVLDRLNYSARIKYDGTLEYIPNWIDTLDTSGTFSATKGFTASKKKLLDLSLSQEGTVVRIPETIRVFFPTREEIVAGGKSYNVPEDGFSVNTITNNVAGFEKITTLSGTIKILWDDMEAIYDVSGILTNSTELSNRATEVSTAFLNSDPSVQHDHRIYSGLLKILPGTNARTVLWYDIGDGLKTEITQKQILPDLTGRVRPINKTHFDIKESCGDHLAGWRPHSTPDADETNCSGSGLSGAGIGSIDLLSSDVPTVGDTNTTSRSKGFIGKDAWELVHTSGVFTSCMWTADHAGFFSQTDDFTVAILLKLNATGTDMFFWDYRGAIIFKYEGSTGKFELLLFDGVSTTTLIYSLIDPAVIDTWYGGYIRWTQSTKVAELSVTPVTTETRNAFESASALSTDLTNGSTENGMFFGDASSGEEAGMNGALDRPVFWQKKLLDCEINSDWNCGLLRYLPAHNKFFTGPPEDYSKEVFKDQKTTGFDDTSVGTLAFNDGTRTIFLTP